MGLDNKKIFIAGSTGMAGMSILRFALENCPKTKISASWHNAKPIIKDSRITYVQGDLKSIQDCRNMVKGCDCAVMAAAHAGGADFTRRFPWEHMRENLLMNMQMLEAFCLEKVKRIIFIGSAVLYQEFEGGIKEDDLDLNKEPHEAYFGFAWGMRFLEKICKFLHSKYQTEIVITRTANIFGPYDKFNPHVSNFTPAIIRKAVDKMEPFEVWGSPRVTRDVLYADDFARAIIMMAGDNTIKFDIFNLGSGEKTTVGN
ncbi:MAG: NAD-dependent epimerase/dehydratase family protein, partial [Candidatus Berkelbacteria bacterium]|nr:NAD-dependent epimerase/dehydratase family protein [Candidatus Berkelbacteria bacterium]